MAINIVSTLDKLDDIFGVDAAEITNRASVVSIYLFVEELAMNGQLAGKETDIKDFYIRFMRDVREEAKLGIDATSRFLLSYESKILQAADSRSSINERHDKLKNAFEHYLKTREIIR